MQPSKTFDELKKLPDITLVNNIKQNLSPDDSIKILSERHSGLYAQTVLRTTGDSIPNLKEDLMQEKMSIVYSAATTYDESRCPKFSTYLANMARWNCLHNKSEKKNCEIPCDNDTIDLILNAEEKFAMPTITDDFLMNRINEEIAAIPNETAQRIIKMRYFCSSGKNNSWKKIANSLQLSIQGCIDIHNRYLSRIRKNIEKKYKETTYGN